MNCCEPRTRVLNLDDTFMAMAIIVSSRSKDPNTQVGACLVDTFNRIIGTGYNGFPRGIDNSELPWAKHGFKPEETKYMYVAHAEENAIDNCDRGRLKNSRLYVTLFPCNKCAIRIIQNEIKEIIYLSDKYHDDSECIAARKLFDLSRITTRIYIPNEKEIMLSLCDGSVKLNKNF